MQKHIETLQVLCCLWDCKYFLSYFDCRWNNKSLHQVKNMMNNNNLNQFSFGLCLLLFNSAVASQEYQIWKCLCAQFCTMGTDDKIIPAWLSSSLSSAATAALCLQSWEELWCFRAGSSLIFTAAFRDAGIFASLLLQDVKADYIIDYILIDR